MEKIAVVILAAGQGTRMKSKLPKVLHWIGNKPMLEHVYCSAKALGAHDIHVVYGHGGEMVQDQLAHMDVDWVLQDQQLGTGHAVDQAMPHVDDDEIVMVLYGDVPLVRQSTLQRLLDAATDSGFGLLTAKLDDPSGYGRIIRNHDGKVIKIVEQKDANEAELAVKEVNTGLLAVTAQKLRAWLSRLENNNAQGEYYLTDIVEMAVNDGIVINTAAPETIDEIMGANNRVQLAELERNLQLRLAEKLMIDGVTLRDPQRLDVRGEVMCGQDIVIDINVVLEGQVVLGNNVTIGPNCTLKNCEIAANAVIEANCVIEDTKVGNGAVVGPFARLRPGTVLAEQSRIGNFVEVKNARIGTGSKVNHLSYIGDTVMGSGVNIGAGTITCNYDGANKHQTTIGDRVFIGSDTQLVAPVIIGDDATIAAGSTVTKDAPANELTISRVAQKSIKGWTRPLKNK